MVADILKRTIGVNFDSNGIAEVLVWSPEAKSIDIKIADSGTIISLASEAYGFWRTKTEEIKAGSLYKFRINGDKDYPDPASLYQPEGVHGPSQAVNLKQFPRVDNDWNNIDLDKYIIYELHVGTFTPEGNFAAIEKKLSYLKDLGITAIEIMPVAQFPGTRNWGYDGVYPFAVQNSYGGPAGLRQLVDACHEAGLAVILDAGPNATNLAPCGNFVTSRGGCGRSRGCGAQTPARGR